MNRRRERRRKTLLSDKVIFNNRRGALDCIVKDLSPGGARIELGGWPKFRCQVVRYTDNMMNMRFVGALA